MAEQKHGQHDSYDENGYQQRCDCDDCKRKYKEWCEERKHDGATKCHRRCYTVCEFKCEKPVTTVYKWGHHERYEGKWECYDDLPVPDKCHKCKKDHKDCKCKHEHEPRKEQHKHCSKCKRHHNDCKCRKGSQWHDLA